MAVGEDQGSRKYREVSQREIEDASVVLVPKEDDLVRADCDSDMLGAWLSIVGDGLAVKSVDAPSVAPSVRYAAAALNAPATL